MYKIDCDDSDEDSFYECKPKKCNKTRYDCDDSCCDDDQCCDTDFGTSSCSFSDACCDDNVTHDVDIEPCESIDDECLSDSCFSCDTTSTLCHMSV
jgi:hypothetical protein